MEIKTTDTKDLIQVAKCHISAFPSSFSSQLGGEYVTKMLEWYIITDKAFLFHLEEKGVVLGYCGAIISDGTLPTGAASGMTQHSMIAAIRAILIRPWLFFHPEMTNRYRFIWKNLKMKLGLYRPQRSLVNKEKLQKEPAVGLVVIGVDQSLQGKGYGSQILQEFENRSKAYGYPLLRLTVRSDNEKAIKAYERNGWLKGKHNGNSMVMFKNISK